MPVSKNDTDSQYPESHLNTYASLQTMKNCNRVDTKVSCSYCHVKGFFVTYAFGADYASCPFCGSLTDTCVSNGDEWITYWFCQTCNVIFDACCDHYDGETCDSDENISNAHLICKYMFQGDVYDGMPLFDGGIAEAECKFPQCTMLQWTCPNSKKASTRWCPCCREEFVEDCEIVLQERLDKLSEFDLVNVDILHHIIKPFLIREYTRPGMI